MSNNETQVGTVDRVEPDGNRTLLHLVRIVILTDPTPNAGAKLVKTVFRVQAQAREK
jgi:hypothetical protein